MQASHLGTEQETDISGILVRTTQLAYSQDPDRIFHLKGSTTVLQL